MLKPGLHILFAIAWAVLGFEVIRSLAAVFRVNRRVAAGSAVAVCGAFFLGATGPLAWSASVPVSQGSIPASPVATSQQAGNAEPCPSKTRLSRSAASGYIDSVQIANDVPMPITANSAPSITIPHGARFKLTGWAALPSGPGAAICLIVDGHTVAGKGIYGSARPDVAAATRMPADSASGYISEGTLLPGKHDVSVGVLESDGRTVAPLSAVVHTQAL